jgi:hypothetical protein
MRHPQRDDAHGPSAEDEYSDHLTRHPNRYSANYIKVANEPVRSGGAHADGEPNEPFKRPDAMAFVAILGVISLIGMVIPHSVMLMCWRRCSRSSSCRRSMWPGSGSSRST